MKDTLMTLFDRDLKRLKNELQSYQNEEVIWETSIGINNSAGHLSLHLVGNLNHYIGFHLGKSNFVRNREEEFSGHKRSLTELLKMVDDTMLEINQALLQFPEDWLSRNYPEDVFGYEMSNEFFLVHLISHFNYHLGQINYHRRILDK